MKELIDIQANLKAPKNQRNAFGKYNYRSCEDILEGVKPLLKEFNCTLVVNDKIELIGDRFYIKATATLKNSDGDVEVSEAYARESENKKGMDSAQITGATSSYARKYALNGLFAIDDTKDADSQDNSEKKQQPQYNNYQKPEQKPQPKKELTEQEKKDIQLKESLDEYKLNIGALLTQQEELGLNKVAIVNSIKKHLNVDKLGNCGDINALGLYYIHCQNKITELKKGV